MNYPYLTKYLTVEELEKARKFDCLDFGSASTEKVHAKAIREHINYLEEEEKKYRPAIVVSHRGLKARARDYYKIGMKVRAYVDSDDMNDVNVVPSQFGDSSICPRSMVKFTD